VLKKLLALVAALLVSAVMAVPAFAQSADLTIEWGSADWLTNLFGGVPGFCDNVGQSPDDQAVWEAMFPGISDWCGLEPPPTTP
jgi:hypothetical protein